MAFNAEFPGSQGKKGNQMGYKVLLSERRHAKSLG